MNANKPSYGTCKQIESNVACLKSSSLPLSSYDIFKADRQIDTQSPQNIKTQIKAVNSGNKPAASWLACKKMLSASGQQHKLI